MMSETRELSILLVSFHYPPETGAASTRLEALTTRWAERGHNVTVLTSAPDFPDGELYDDYANDWIQREERDGVSIVMTKTLPGSSTDPLVKRGIKYVWFMLAAILVGLRLRKPDVVVSTSPQPFAGIAGWAVARLRRVPFVFEVRDLWPESLVAMSDFDNRPLVEFLDQMTDFLYSHADRVVVVAPGMRETVVSGGADPDDVWVHTNGVDPAFFDVSNAPAVPECEPGGLLDDKFIVSYVGTVGRAQGLDIVLDVAVELQDVPSYDDVVFAIVGFGSEYDDLRKRAEREGLDNVAFLGKRPKPEVPAFLNASDVALVHTKDREVFRTMIPMKLYEALGAGLPVVLGAKGDAVTILERAKAGIVVTPEDADELEAAIRRLHDDPELRTEMGERGERYVRENHVWDAIARRYSEDLSKLVTGA